MPGCDRVQCYTCRVVNVGRLGLTSSLDTSGVLWRKPQANDQGWPARAIAQAEIRWARFRIVSVPTWAKDKHPNSIACYLGKDIWIIMNENAAARYYGLSRSVSA